MRDKFSFAAVILLVGAGLTYSGTASQNEDVVTPYDKTEEWSLPYKASVKKTLMVEQEVLKLRSGIPVSEVIYLLGWPDTIHDMQKTFMGLSPQEDGFTLQYRNKISYRLTWYLSKKSRLANLDDRWVSLYLGGDGKSLYHVLANKIEGISDMDKSRPPDMKIRFSPEGPQDLISLGKQELQKQVNDCRTKGNVRMRNCVDYLFALADVLAGEGNEREAYDLYNEALQVNSWRLSYQMKMAKLLIKYGYPKNALEKAQFVFRHAEEQEQIQQAGEMMRSLGTEPSVIGEEPLNGPVQIMLVPIGKINVQVVRELSAKLHEMTGLGVRISMEEMELGASGRRFSPSLEASLIQVYEGMRAQLSQKEYDEITGGRDPKNTQERLKHIGKWLEKNGATPEQMADYRSSFDASKGQYHAAKLLAALKKKFPIPEGSKIIGFLGVTEKDIYGDNTNYLFG